MAEKAFWAFLRDRMKHMGHLVRIENGTQRGCPDVNGCIRGYEFWWELKEIPQAPRDNKAPLLIDHYTNEQRLWLRARGLAGGRAFLFLRVCKPTPVYLLFDHDYAYQYVGRVSMDELMHGALMARTVFEPDEIMLTMKRFRK